MMPHGTRHVRRDEGWSYVELLAAITLLVIGVLALAAGYLNASRLSEETRTTNAVLTACNNVIERIRSVPYPDVVDEFGSGSGKTVAYCLPDGEISFTRTSDAIARGMIRIFNDPSRFIDTFPSLSGSSGLEVDGGVLDMTLPEDAEVLPITVRFTIPTSSGSRDLETHYLLSES